MNEHLKGLLLSREEEIFSSRIEDLFSMCDRKNIPKFSGFLDLRQQKIADVTACGIDFSAFSFYGGYQDAERKMFGVFPDYVTEREEEFPICYLEVVHSRPLNHRDFLGSLMSLGIKREIVGDILVGEEKSYIIVQDAMSQHIIDSLSKIGNVGIKIRKCEQSDIALSDNRFEECSEIVSSMRLDCVIAALISKSRAEAARFVEGERVSVNHEIITSGSKQLCAGDVVSVRSFGKFIIGECNAKTKKGRLVLNYKKYI